MKNDGIKYQGISIPSSYSKSVTERTNSKHRQWMPKNDRISCRVEGDFHFSLQRYLTKEIHGTFVKYLGLLLCVSLAQGFRAFSLHRCRSNSRGTCSAMSDSEHHGHYGCGAGWLQAD
eukprot:565893-Amphidinium_carterae.1